MGEVRVRSAGLGAYQPQQAAARTSTAHWGRTGNTPIQVWDAAGVHERASTRLPLEARPSASHVSRRKLFHAVAMKPPGRRSVCQPLAQRWESAD